MPKSVIYLICDPDGVIQQWTSDSEKMAAYMTEAAEAGYECSEIKNGIAYIIQPHKKF